MQHCQLAAILSFVESSCRRQSVRAEATKRMFEMSKPKIKIIKEVGVTVVVYEPINQNMVCCCVPNCSNSSKNSTYSFYRFPVDQKTRKQWIRLIRRENFVPTDTSRVCSWHFTQGKSAGPNRFSWNIDKSERCKSPESKKRKSREPTLAEKYELLKRENDTLKCRVKELETLQGQMSYSSIKDNTEAVQMYTGLPGGAYFDVIVQLLQRFNIKGAKWTVSKVSPEDQLLITLMKFRLNIPNLDLALRFGKSTTTISNIIQTYIDALHSILVEGLRQNIPSREKNMKSLPESFKDFYACRIILDCTEVTIDKPQSMSEQNSTYSNYKSRNTFKALVGISPNGHVTFTSSLYPGSASDKAIVADSKVLQSMVPGDMVMADKGFVIYDLLPEGVSLNIPPFLRRPQFTANEVLETASIARARIHVERAIQRIKIYKILDQIAHFHRGNASRIFQICASLTNFQTPIINMNNMND